MKHNRPGPWTATQDYYCSKGGVVNLLSLQRMLRQPSASAAMANDNGSCRTTTSGVSPSLFQSKQPLHTMPRSPPEFRLCFYIVQQPFHTKPMRKHSMYEALVDEDKLIVIGLYRTKSSYQHNDFLQSRGEGRQGAKEDVLMCKPKFLYCYSSYFLQSSSCAIGPSLKPSTVRCSYVIPSTLYWEVHKMWVTLFCQLPWACFDGKAGGKDIEFYSCGCKQKATMSGEYTTLEGIWNIQTLLLPAMKCSFFLCVSFVVNAQFILCYIILCWCLKRHSGKAFY